MSEPVPETGVIGGLVVDSTDSPQPGASVMLTPQAVDVTTADPAVMLPKSLHVVTGPDGRFSATVMATDTMPGVSWQWRVDVSQGRSKTAARLLSVPAGAVVDLVADGAVVADETPTRVTVKGDRGLSAYEVAVEQGFTGAEAEWLDAIAAPLAVAHLGDGVYEIGGPLWQA